MALPAQQNGSPAGRRSTPSRSTPSGPKRVNGPDSPFRQSLNGSPSLQMLRDYGKVFASEERALKRSLDDATSEQQAKHIRALDYGLKEHQRVRESAERELEYIRLENEREARRKAELESQRIEEARRRLEQQKEDEQRRRVEEEKARQDDERRREDLRRQEEEDARKRAAEQQQRDQEETAQRQQREKEESDRKAREEAEAKQREQKAQKERETAAQQQAAAPPPQLNGAAPPSAAPTQNAPPPSIGGYPPGFVSTPSEIETTHNQYLELHRRLKAMRKHVVEQVGKISKDQKDQLSEWRREIKKAIGMFRKAEDAKTKSDNRDRLQKIMGYLDRAAHTTEPMIDIAQFIVDNQQPPGAKKEGPGQLLFLLNHFAKSVCKQLVREVSMEPELGNALGILAVTVFARPTYLFNGQSLIDLLWAKYHRHCPALFGISGNEATAQGRKRMGWVYLNDLLSPEEFYGNTRGYAVGFSNITLRSFAKSQNKNPAPNRIFWQAIARILNMPTDQVQPAHFEVLKAIVEHTTPRITSVYGSAALALVRQACITFPARHEASVQNPAAKSTIVALKSLPHILLQKYQLKL